MSIELKILDFIQTLHTPVLDKIMVGITRLGDAGIIWIILTAIFLVIPKTRRAGGVMLAALVVQTILCNVILKNLFARTRPYDVNTTVQLLVPKLHDFLSRRVTHQHRLQQWAHCILQKIKPGNRRWYLPA